jgi:hypothetical protein
MEVAVIKPPAHYGVIKRGLFKAGVLAYHNPNGLARKLYDGGAAVVGAPLAAINPYYDWGGIRREVQIALKQEDGRIGLNFAVEILTEDQIKRGFHEKFVSGPFERKRFSSAWHNLIYLSSSTLTATDAGKFFSLAASASLFSLFLQTSFGFFQGQLPRQGIAIGAIEVILSRVLFQVVSKEQKALNPLIDYMKGLNIETLSSQTQHCSLSPFEKSDLLCVLRKNGIRDYRLSVFNKIRVENDDGI